MAPWKIGHKSDSLLDLVRLRTRRVAESQRRQHADAQITVHDRSPVVRTSFYAFHTATCPVRRDWFARWAALAALTPASAGQLGFFLARTASTQFARCSNS